MADGGLRSRTPPGILTNGEVAEWPKAPLSKSGSALKVLVGSNPTLSATVSARDFLAFADQFSYFRRRRDVRVAEGARLESVWAVISCPVGSNPTLSAIMVDAGRHRPARPGMVWSCAAGTCEPRQVRKEAAVNRISRVPQGCLA